MHKALLQKFFIIDSKYINSQIGGNIETLNFYLPEKPNSNTSISINENSKIVYRDDRIMFEESTNTFSESFTLNDELTQLGIKDIKFDAFGFLIVTIESSEETDLAKIKEIIKTLFKVDEYNPEKIIATEGYKKVFLLMNNLPSYSSIWEEQTEWSSERNLYINKVTGEQIYDKPDPNKDIKLTLKESLAKKFGIKSTDLSIKNFDGKFLIIFLTELTNYQDLITKITETTLFQEGFEKDLKIDISSGNSLTELSSSINLLTKSITNLPIDSLGKYVGETTEVLSKLKSINPEDIEKISQVENLFENFSTSLQSTAEDLVIKTKKMPVIVVPTPEIEDKTSSLLTIFAQISDKINEISSLSAAEETELILSEIETNKTKLDEYILQIDKSIKEFNDARDALQSVKLTEEYFKIQKQKRVSLCRACKRTFEPQEGMQDMVFYNGTAEEVLRDSYQPMISLPNIIVSESKKNTEITDELVSKIAEKSFSAAQIDTSNLESYLQATQVAQAAGSLYKINYSGGNLEVEVKETKQIVQKTSDLKLKTLQFKRKIMEYQSALGEFKLAYVQSFYYSLFIIISINNSILTSSQLIYELLSVGNCQYYLNIVNVILDKIASGDIGPAERFFQKYHFLILKDMKLLLEFVIEETKSKKGDIEKGVFNGVQSNIIVSKSKGKFASLLSIFNSFKDILDAYKSQVLPPVSVYVRINDWTQDNSLKVANGSNNLPIDQRAEEDIIFTRNEADGRFLDVSLDKCSKLHYDQEEKLTIDKNSSNYVRDYDEVKKIKVEEVLASQEIPSNDAINKYMGLSSELQKKDTMLITYGTSGIGKSFALFGGRGQKGLLQSTLSEIRGKPKISFRTYELYSMGVQYPFYWENRKDIYQRCFTYDFDTSGELEVSAVNMIDSYDDIIQFINKTKTPSDEDSGFHDIEFRHYNNFVDIVEKIDDVRGKQSSVSQPDHWPQRIKKTTNNPQSSRSIIIYEFLIQFSKDNNKRLVIVDLPGLEDPKISYVENPKFKIDDDVVEGAKILGASFLMNPIFIPLFKQEYTRAIKEFIISQPLEIKNGWRDTDMITLSSTKDKKKKIITKEKVGLYISPTLELTEEAIGNKSTGKKGKFQGKDQYLGPGLDTKNNETGDLQRFNNCFVYFILYIIKIGRIDILVDLITFIIQKEGVVQGSIGNWEESTDDNQINYTSLKEKIKLAYEGIAINENILGLIYFLISKVEKTSDKDKLFKNPSYGIKSQADIAKGPTPQTDEKDRRVSYDGKSLSNEATMKQYIDEDRILKETAGEIFAREARTIIRTAYSSIDDPDLNTFDLKGDGVTTTKSLYKDSVDSYDHQKIFTVPNNLGDKEWLPSSEVQKRVANKQIPLIFDYLSPYLGAGPTSPQEWTKKLDPESGNPYYYNATTGITQWEKPEGFEEESKGIESVILFTLLTNNDPKKKCLIQINLLKDSLGFLKELVV